jgi:succinoglycan biosynthesis transport protein ExoP
MAQTPEEQASEPLDLNRYVNLARRRHLQFLIPLFVGWVVVFSASWFLPVRYKSSTLILVEQPTMPKDYVAPNVTDDLQTRLQSITQQILSRSRLLLIIDKLHLYSNGNATISPDDKVERMRSDIGEVELVRDNRGDQITAFRVSYSASDPHTAQQVTSELTNLFIHESQKVVQQESQDTTDFIASQLENARQTLSSQEAKVREFQGQHEGTLPEQQTSNLQILSGLQQQLQNEQDALNSSKQQRVYLQSLIEQNRSVHGATRTVDGVPTGLAAIDEDLSKLRAKLADLSSHYTDRYPDVLAVKQEIVKTEKIREEFIADAKNNKGEASTSDPLDPTQGGPGMQLQSQLRANQLEISNREQSIVVLKSRINDYQSRLNEEPAVEQQLADLNRGYTQSQADYDELLKKKNQSEMATNLEQVQQGERFTMLDPPTLPIKPDFPNRIKFCGIGLGIGLVLGLIVAGGFEFLDDRMYSEKDIKKLFDVAVLSEIPEIQLPSDERLAMRRATLGWSVTAVVIVTILAGSAFSFLHG